MIPILFSFSRILHTLAHSHAHNIRSRIYNPNEFPIYLLAVQQICDGCFAVETVIDHCGKCVRKFCHFLIITNLTIGKKQTSFKFHCKYSGVFQRLLRLFGQFPNYSFSTKLNAISNLFFLRIFAWISSANRYDVIICSVFYLTLQKCLNFIRDFFVDTMRLFLDGIKATYDWAMYIFLDHCKRRT